MQQVLYFYEGECEEKLLKYLKNKNIIKAGKTKKFNLWQNKIKSITRMLSKSKKLEIYFIVDTDKLADLSIFKSNIESLKGYNFCLIIQHKNLEDELSYICHQKEKQLFNEFDACNKNEFTSKFIKESNLQSKLKNCTLSALWSRNNDFVNFLQEKYIKISTNCKYKL